jgi:PAS domain S-box-containing protein
LDNDDPSWVLPFCAHARTQADLCLVPDTARDIRFMPSPDQPVSHPVRFYAGLPLRNSEGSVLGSLCLLDVVPRELSASQEAALRAVGRQTVALLTVRLKAAEQAHMLHTWEEAVESLRESEGRLRSLFQSAVDAIVLADPYGRILSWNQSAGRLFGYSAEEVLGQSLTWLMPARYRAAHEGGLARVRSTGETRILGKTMELQGLKKNGTEFPLELSLTRWVGHYGTIYCGIIRDVTDRKRAEEERERLILQLQEALASVKTLSGLLPICATCKKIRDDSGYWNRLESYLAERSGVEFTHGLCPECARQMHPDWDEEEGKASQKP